MDDLDLVADLAKKAGLVWLRSGGRDHPVWHTWVGDAICVVGDGAEQPLPAVSDGDVVVVLLRSKSNRQLAASVEAVVEVIAPDSPSWEVVTSALKSGRLNLPDADDAIDLWARDSRVLRLAPRPPVIMADDLPHRRRLSSPPLSG